jgi:hypothetical protein
MGKKEIKQIMKSKFIGTCERIRQDPTGEKWWHSVMKQKKPISEKTFLKHINPVDVLDIDENWKDYISDLRRQDKVSFYKSDGTYFFQTAGFEFFWKKR